MSLGLKTDEGRFERTAPYLKLSQIEDMKAEGNRLKSMLEAPRHISAQIQDRSQVYNTLKRIETSLARDTAQPYVGADLDKAVKREKEIRDAFVADMCTQAEMRRNPPGALDKHLAFEEKHGRNIGEWKNIRRRLHVSGALPSHVSERSLSNIEMFRPAGGAGEMSMDGAQIPQTKSYHGLGGRSTTFTDVELALLEQMAPKLKNMIALLSADERDEVKAALSEAQGQAATPVVDTKPITELNFKEARERCRALELDTGGTREDLIFRLQEYYAKQNQG